MSEKNEAVAESIINREVYIFRQAKNFGEVCEARAALKERLLRELELAEGRGSHP